MKDLGPEVRVEHSLPAIVNAESVVDFFAGVGKFVLDAEHDKPWDDEWYEALHGVMPGFDLLHESSGLSANRALGAVALDKFVKLQLGHSLRGMLAALDGEALDEAEAAS